MLQFELCVPEQLGNTLQIPAIQQFCVSVQQVGDLRCAVVHACFLVPLVESANLEFRRCVRLRLGGLGKPGLDATVVRADWQNGFSDLSKNGWQVRLPGQP
ncbi:hypothetical protein D3C72_2164670 [compost metagenome]